MNKSKTLAVTLATLMSAATALPTMAANGYDSGFIKTADRSSVTQKRDGPAENLHQVRGHDDGRGGGRYSDRGHHGGGRDRGHRDHYSYRGDYHGHRHVKPRHRYYYDRPYGYHDHYHYNDFLGAFILGGTLGYILND